MPSKDSIFRNPSGQFFAVEFSISPSGIEVSGLPQSKSLLLPWSGISFAAGGEDKNSLELTTTLGTLFISSSTHIRRLKAASPQSVQYAMRSAVESLRSERQRRYAFIAGISVVAIIGIWWALLVSGNVTFYLVDTFLPQSAEAGLGDQAYQVFKQSYPEITDKRILEPLQTILKRFEAVPTSNPHSFDLHILDVPEVNAVAFPGGKIVVFTGLLRQASSYDEVAGILAHEAQHVLLKHGIKNMSKSIGFIAAFQIIRIAFGFGSSGLDSLVPELLSASFSRQQEAEADHHGALLAHAAGFPIQGMIAFFEREAKTHTGAEVLNFLASHPVSSERVSELRRVAASLPALVPARIEPAWDLYRGQVKEITQ